MRDGLKDGPVYMVDFWMSEATPHWGISCVEGTFGGQGDSRDDAIAAACTKLTELARQPWRDVGVNE